MEVEAEAAAAAAALKFSNRIRPIDIIRVPLYERVWEVGAMGQVKCNFVCIMSHLLGYFMFSLTYPIACLIVGVGGEMFGFPTARVGQY